MGAYWLGGQRDSSALTQVGELPGAAVKMFALSCIRDVCKTKILLHVPRKQENKLRTFPLIERGGWGICTVLRIIVTCLRGLEET